MSLSTWTNDLLFVNLLTITSARFEVLFEKFGFDVVELAEFICPDGVDEDVYVEVLAEVTRQAEAIGYMVGGPSDRP